MAALVVTTASDTVDPDDGLLSLREAMAQSNATATVDTISFAASLEGQTLTLAQGELTISRDVTIDGDLNNDGVEVTLSGGFTESFGSDGSRIFHIVGGET